MDRRLSVPQLFALTDLEGVEKVAAYQVERPVRVFRALQKEGLAECLSGSGQHSVWRITDAGRALLRSLEG